MEKESSTICILWIEKKSTTRGSLPWKVETVWQFSLHCLKGIMNLVLNYRCVHIGGDLICGVRHSNTSLLGLITWCQEGGRGGPHSL